MFLVPMLGLVITADKSIAWSPDSTANAPVCVAPYAQHWTRMASDQAGGAIVVWEDNRSDSNGVFPDIYAQRLQRDGTIGSGWPVNGLAVCQTPNAPSLMPSVISDGSDGALVAFEDGRATGPTHGGIYVQHVNAAGTALWIPNGVLVSGSSGAPTGSAFDPTAIVPDGHGGAFVAWLDMRLNFAFVQNIFAQHISADGSLLWSSQGVGVWTGTQGAYGVVIAPDTSGGAFFAWADNRDAYGTSRIFAQHVAANGALLWNPGGVQVSTSPYFQGFSSISQAVADGMDGFYVGWSDNANSDSSNAYVQHITSNGTISPGWPSYGVRLSLDPNPTHFQAAPTLTADGAGGVVLAFRDSRFLDIRAQRVDPAGNLLWGPSGVSVTGLNGGIYHATVPDGSGGFIFGTLYSNTVYGQRVGATGNLLWKEGGVAVGAANSMKRDLVGAADGAHGAIFAWSDNRNEPQNDYSKSGDIYAQNVKPDGTIGGSTVATLLALATADAAPDRVVLRWSAPDRNVSRATVYRSTDGVEWLSVGVILPDGTGMLRYEDHDVVAGHRYGYRLEGETTSGIVPSEISWISVPSALKVSFEGPWPQPTQRDVNMRITVPTSTHARLQLFDVAGRVVAKAMDAVLEPGSHTLRWELRGTDGKALPDGAYLALLDLNGRVLSRRLIVVK